MLLVLESLLSQTHTHESFLSLPPQEPTHKQPVIVAGKDVKEVDNDYFLIPVSIKDHEGPLKTNFPIENRLLPQGAYLALFYSWLQWLQCVIRYVPKQMMSLILIDQVLIVINCHPFCRTAILHMWQNVGLLAAVP